jgi:hypothetical protein
MTDGPAYLMRARIDFLHAGAAQAGDDLHYRLPETQACRLSLPASPPVRGAALRLGTILTRDLDNNLASTGDILAGSYHLHRVKPGSPCSTLSKMHGPVRDDTKTEYQLPRTTGFLEGLTRSSSSSLRSRQTSVPLAFGGPKISESPKGDCDPCIAQLAKSQRSLLTSAEH